MIKLTRSVITILVMSIGLSISTQPPLNAHAQDNLKIVTALLRGPAAYLEYELRNDTSRSAHAQKALIAAIRLVNDLHSHTTLLQHHAFGWCLYDAKEIFVHLKALLTAQKQLTQLTQNPAEQNLSNDKDYQSFRRFVLPTLEMLSALGRTEFVRSKLPHRGGSFAGIAITMSRLGQLYLAAPQSSTERKIIIALFTWCFVDILTEIKRIHDVVRDDQREEEQRQPALRGVFRRIRIIKRTENSEDRPNGRYTENSEGLKECSVCLDKPKEPHALQCGHVFCKKCIGSCMIQKQKCPYCNQENPEILYEI